MSNKESILRFIGLAMRASKVVSGFDMVTRAISDGNVKMIIIAEDISSNTLSKLLDVVESRDDISIDAYRFGTSFELGNAIGKPNRAIIAIVDEGFSKKLSIMLSELVDSEENS